MLLDDSQMLRKPKIPVYLDDPDMLFGALHTPKPALRVLQTEAQQENVSGVLVCWSLLPLMVRCGRCLCRSVC